MLYLKKNNETQTAFIPKNGEYEGKKTYKEGYDEGYNEGLYVGKLTPYTTKGVFDKNGYYDRVWAIDWSRNVEMPISWLDNDNIIEVSFFALENSALISTSGAFIDIFLQDEKMIVNYKNFMLEIPCKYQMWHTLKLQGRYVYLNGERYEYPNFDEYFNGTAFFGKSRRNGMFCRSFVSYIYVTEDNGVEMYYYYGREDGKVKRLRNENGNWLFQTMEFGVWNYATNTPPMDNVLVRVEGGNCPELTELNVSQNGRYEGAYNVVNVDVPDVNGSYDEGYNNGYNDGKAEGGGSCNLGQLDVNWVSGWTENRFYAFNDGYDGYSAVSIYVGDALNEKYNEGYEAGKAEGGDCPELTELNVTENGTYEGAYNKVNVDVPTEGGSCNIEETRWAEPTPADVDGSGYLVYHKSEGYDGMDRVALNMNGYNALKYNEGYEAGKNEGGGCDYQDYRELVLRAKVENAGFADENTFWDKSKIIKYDDFNNEETANTIMFFDYDTEGWRGDYVTIVQKVSRMIKIKEGLFTNLEEIYEMEIECTKIDENAFKGCTNLTKLVLPYPSTIGENAFKDCTNLKEIVFNTIGDISPSAFDGCPKTGIIKAKDNRFDPSKLPSTLSNWRIVYVLSGEVEEPLTPTAIEEVYDKLAFRTENLYDGDIIRDKSKLLDDSGESAEGYFITYTQNKNSVVICSQNKYTAPHVTTIENNALDWNKIKYFYSFTINTFGVNMTRDAFSNVRGLYITNDWMNTITFKTGCFATSNLLNKIVFYAPYDVVVEENAFEGVSSYGEVIVVGEDNAENRARYDDLMSQLGDGWNLRFVNEYNK